MKKFLVPIAMLFISIINLFFMHSVHTVAAKNEVEEIAQENIRAGYVYTVGQTWQSNPDYYFKDLPEDFDINQIPNYTTYGFQGPSQVDPELVKREDYLFCIAKELGLTSFVIYTGEIYDPNKYSQANQELVYFNKYGEVIDIETGEKTGEKLFVENKLGHQIDFSRFEDNDNEIALTLPAYQANRKMQLRERDTEDAIADLSGYYDEVKWLVANFHFGQKYLEDLKTYQQAVATQLAIWRYTNAGDSEVQYTVENISYIKNLYEASNKKPTPETGYDIAYSLLEDMEVTREDWKLSDEDSATKRLDVQLKNSVNAANFPKELGDFKSNTQFELDLKNVNITVDGTPVDLDAEGIKISLDPRATDVNAGLYGVTIKFPVFWYNNVPKDAEIDISVDWTQEVNAHTSSKLIVYTEDSKSMQPLVDNFGSYLRTQGTITQVIHKKMPVYRSFTLRKVDSSNTNQSLSGAEFELYKKDEVGNFISTDKTYPTQYGVITLSEDEIAELGVGTYKFKETKAPLGYVLPNDKWTEEFVITEDSVSPDQLTKTNVKAETPHNELNLLKLDKDTGEPLSGATFEIRYCSNSSCNNKVYDQLTTDHNGQITLYQEALNEIYNEAVTDHNAEPPTLHFQIVEVDSPSGYPDPSNEDREDFYLEGKQKEGPPEEGPPVYEVTEVSPKDIIMYNERIFNHKIILIKTVKNNPNVNTDGIEFVIQGLDQDGVWKQYDDSIYTVSGGPIVIDDAEFIKQMIDDVQYSEFRFREYSVPQGSGLVPPYYPPNGQEPFGAGNNFAVDIGIKELREANTDKPLELTLENELQTYDLFLQKKDSVSKELLDGAEFTLTESSSNESEISHGHNGYFEFKGLVIGKTYVLKETTAPEGYGLQDVEYHIKLDDDLNMSVEKYDDGKKDSNFTDKDYSWDGTLLELHMTIENTAMPKIPMTGGRGLLIYMIIALVLICLGSLLYYINIIIN